MNRETIKVITPIGKQEIELKAWLTGREKREITNLFLEKAQIGETGLSGIKIDSEIINRAQDKAFETVVVSIDGKTEGILEKILDMRSEDFEFLVNEVNKITGGKGDDDVKKK